MCLIVQRTQLQECPKGSEAVRWLTSTRRIKTQQPSLRNWFTLVRHFFPFPLFVSLISRIRHWFVPTQTANLLNMCQGCLGGKSAHDKTMKVNNRIRIRDPTVRFINRVATPITSSQLLWVITVLSLKRSDAKPWHMIDLHLSVRRKQTIIARRRIPLIKSVIGVPLDTKLHAT